MVTTMLADWESITPPPDAASLNVLRADPSHPLNFRIGRDAQARFAFQLEAAGNLPDVHVEDAPAGMDVTMDDLGGGIGRLTLLLHDGEDLPIFRALCGDLLSMTHELQPSEAARAMRYRAQLRAKGIRIFADAHVKHGAHAIVADRPVEEQVKDLVFFDADAVIATGQRTGHAADLDYIRMIKEASGLPTLVGSGVTPENARDILDIVDGVIVASSLKHDGVWWNPVEPERVKRFIAGLGR